LIGIAGVYWGGIARIVENLRATSDYGPPSRSCALIDAIAILHVAGQGEGARSMLQSFYADLKRRNISTGAALDLASRLNITLSTG